MFAFCLMNELSQSQLIIGFLAKIKSQNPFQYSYHSLKCIKPEDRDGQGMAALFLDANKTIFAR